MVARWVDIGVIAAIGLLIVACGGGTILVSDQTEEPAIDQPVAENPLEEPVTDDTDNQGDTGQPADEQSPEPEDPDLGWRPGVPDPSWVVSPAPPNMFLAASYDRPAQDLSIVVDHEWNLKMFLSITRPEGVTLAGCEEYYDEKHDEYLVRGGGGALVFHLLFAEDAADFGEIRITARDSAGWYALEQLEVMRSVYFTEAIYDIAGQDLTITLDAQPNQRCLLELTPPAGLAIAGGNVHERIGPGQIRLDVVVDAGRAEEWEVAALVADELNHTDRRIIELWRLPLGFQENALHAYPLSTIAHVGDPVCVVIATGALAQPLQYVNGVGLTVEAGARLAKNSLNPGAPGHDPNCADGVWGELSPPPEGFLIPDGELLAGETVVTEDDRVLFNLNMTPYWEDMENAPPVDVDGVLFNVKLVFDEPGLYTLGFMDFLTVKRTYYSDIDCTEYGWEDITNRHLGVPFKLLVLGEGEE
ncbi:hypothetical protein JW859_06355 [bacterium]|nr:hypothetical protein [bacterium]